MAVAFGGDETGALVGDVGSFYSKFGFAGEDAAKCVLHSRLAARPGEEGGAMEIDLTDPSSFEFGNERIHVPEPRRRSFVSPLYDGCWDVDARPAGPLEKGELTNWDAIETLWETAFERLKASARDHPVLCAMPSWTTPEAQEMYLELLFERFEAPAVFLSRAASLATFSSGRASAVVVDCGAGTSSACPVVDGYVLLRACEKSTIGGDYLDEKILEKLSEFKPRCVARAERLGHAPPRVSEGLLPLARLDVARELKETLRFDAASKMELPDGTALDPDQFKPVPELLFAPDTGLHALVRKSLHEADVDVRKDLLQSIILSGSGSLFPGLPDRFHHELNANLASTFKTKLVLPSSLERAMAVWIGGSILASLGSFQQQWLSRAEYHDDGPLASQERWN